MVDFQRLRQAGVPGVVQRLEYDPNRTGYIALVQYPPGGWVGGGLQCVAVCHHELLVP